MARFAQNAVNWGEISPSFYGRQDLPQYRAGCSTLRNMFVSPRGGASSRAGTKFVGQCRQTASASSTPPEFIPFTYNVEEAYCLEFGDLYMRVIKDGAYVLEDGFTMSAVTNTNPGVFTATGHDFVDGDWVYLNDMEGMTALNGRTFVVANASGSTFQLQSTLTGDYIDTADLGTYTASSGSAYRVYTLETPYAIEDIHTLKYAQSADVMTITHPLYKPYELSRIADNNWSLDLIDFSTSIVPPIDVEVTPTATVSQTISTRYQYVVTAVDGETGEESIASAIGATITSVNLGITTSASINISWAQVTGAGYYNVYKAQPVYGTPPQIGAIFGYMATAYGLNAVDNNITPDFNITPPLHYNPFATSSIQAVYITGTGSGYTTEIAFNYVWPDVSFTDTTGANASGYAVVQTDGGVYAVVVTNGGEGYSNPSIVVASQQSGSGFAATAIGNGAGKWLGGTNLTITNTGTGYSSGVVIQARWPKSSGVGYYYDYSINTTVSGGGIIYALFQTWSSFYNITASGVEFSVFSGGGSGATATVSIGPSTGTYPSVVAYFQQRRFFANTINKPNTFWGSQPGAYSNFDQTIPITDSDALEGTPWAQQVNGIQWMIPMPGGLVMLTGNGAWQVNGGSAGAPITPINQNAQAQAYNGVSPDVQPLTINFDILFVQHEGSVVRDLAYSFETNIYSGTDITVFSNHLFDSFTVKRWDWAEERNKLVWLCRSDGAALSLTYLKERGITAWARHDTNGIFESVACVSEPPVNAPYFVVKRYINGNWAYYAERMDNRTWTDIEDCWCVDAGLEYPSESPNATLTFSSATGDASITEYEIVDGGTGYTFPTGTVVDGGGTGEGATVQLTVSGGVITAATAAHVGEGYTGPVTVTVTDPATAATGAVIYGTVTNYVTVSASANVFSSANVGDIIRAGGGKMEVVTYINETTVVANIIVPITAVFPNDPLNTPKPVPAGQWTIATPTDTVSGLDHLEGMEVNGLADGGVIGVTTVVNGSITLPGEASKIVVGLPYTCQLQTLFLEAPQGSIQGNRQTPIDVVVRVENSRAPEVGANQPDQAVQPNFATVPWTNMTQIQTRSPSVYAGQPDPLYTGDYFTNLSANWDNNSQIALQQADPVPLNVLSFYPNLKVGN